MAYRELIKLAAEAKKRAYAPYSKFSVGAALLTDKDKVYTGCNIENVSFGATCCAERTAIFKAISEGAQKIRQMAVICDDQDYCLPCGICRQVMLEFASEDFVLAAARPDGSYRILTMDDLLPHAFKKF